MSTGEAAPDEQFDNIAQQRRAILLGMWLFLVTELMLFGGFLAAFGILRVQYAEVFAEAATHLDLMLASINTVVLLTSGLTMVLAERAVGEGRRQLALGFLLATLALGVLFLVMKGYEWYHEFQIALMPVLNLAFDYPGNQPRIAELFFNMYYGLTGLHVIHMVIGTGMLAVMGWLIWQWREPDRLYRQTRTVALYWAFVDVVWVFLYTSLYLLRSHG